MSAPSATPMFGEILATRVVEATATPGPVAILVADYVQQAGIGATKFLGLSLANWIDLGISLLTILVGYALSAWIVNGLLPRLAKRTATTLDDKIIEAVGQDLRKLLLVIVIDFAVTAQLQLLRAATKSILDDVFFVLALFFVTRILWNVLDHSSDWFVRSRPAEHRREIEAIANMLVRVARGLLVLIVITVFLSNFGVNVTALTAILGIGGVAISLAAQDTVSDAIAGAIIMLDRPFLVGHRIEIQGAGTWGDVVDIGLRTTRIRTLDNRMIVVPNSLISKNQVVNYSYPDPSYRIQTHVDIAYGTDLEEVRALLVEAVTRVEGIQPDKPVEALYVDMSGSAMKFRVRWWIASYADTRRMFDRVHTALQKALDAAGIESPNMSSNINLMIDDDTTDKITRAIHPQPSDDPIKNSGSEHQID